MAGRVLSMGSALPMDEEDEDMTASEAMWFAGKTGFWDTARGIGQLIPGDVFEEGMAESQAKLNRLMENPEYGGRVTAAYFGGLLADPVGWALPLAKLKNVGTGLKAATKLAGYGAGTGATIGALGYVDPEAQSLIGEGEMTRGEQALLGGTFGAGIGGAIGGVASARRGVKKVLKDKFGIDKTMKEAYAPVGEVAWKALTTHPEFGTGAGGGLVGYNWDADAPLSRKMKNAFIGATLGAGSTLALRLNPELRTQVGRFAIPDFRLDKGYLDKKGVFKRDRSRMHREFDGLVERIAKEPEDVRKALYTMLTNEGAPIKASMVGLKGEVRKIVTKYGEELKDFGVIDPTLFEKNVNTYLHRSYRRPKTGFWKQFKTTGEKIRTLGDELRMRGKKDSINIEDFKAGRFPDREPGWEPIGKPRKDKTIEVRRDFTEAERADMGEIKDAAFALDRTGRLMANDVAAYRFFRDLASEGNVGKYWSKESSGKFTKLISSANFKDSPNAKIFGDLHGKYVTPEVYADLKRVQNIRGGAVEFLEKIKYRALNRFWKKTKTGWNPATHFNNVLSNIHMYDAYDGKAKHLWAAIKDIKNKGGDYQDAMDDGVFGGGVLSHEMNRGNRDILDAYDSAVRKFSLGAKGDKTIDQLIDHVPDIVKTVARNTGKYTWDGMLKLYQMEDHVFRLGMYKKLRAEGMAKGLSKDDAGIRAAREAREGFVDYEKTSPLLEFLREGPFPFIAYMYGIIPRLAETAVKKPWKMAKWGLIWHGINQMGEDMSDDPEETKKQRALMDPEGQGAPLLGLPGMPSGMIKVPEAISPKTKDDWYVNVARGLPGGTDMFGQRESAPGVIPGLPQFLQPGFGAAGALVNTAMGVDRFWGRDIPEGERLKYLAQQFIPNLPIPGMPSYAGEKLDRAMGGRGSKTKDVHTPASALLSGLGLKLTPVSTRKLKKRRGYPYDKKIRELSTKRRKLKDNWVGELDDDFYKERDKISKEIRQLKREKRQVQNP